jgi:hypothetical protein
MVKSASSRPPPPNLEPQTGQTLKSPQTASFDAPACGKAFPISHLPCMTIACGGARRGPPCTGRGPCKLRCMQTRKRLRAAPRPSRRFLLMRTTHDMNLAGRWAPAHRRSQPGRQMWPTAIPTFLTLFTTCILHGQPVLLGCGVSTLCPGDFLRAQCLGAPHSRCGG